MRGICTAHYLAKNDKPFVDYQSLLERQECNGGTFEVATSANINCWTYISSDDQKSMWEDYYEWQSHMAGASRWISKTTLIVGLYLNLHVSTKCGAAFHAPPAHQAQWSESCDDGGTIIEMSSFAWIHYGLLEEAFWGTYRWRQYHDRNKVGRS